MSEPPRPSFYPLMPRLLCRADESERVKRSREAKQRISDPEGIGEVLLRRADREVRRDVRLQLRLAAAERRDRGERDQLTVLDRNVFARVAGPKHQAVRSSTMRPFSPSAADSCIFRM